MLWWNKYLYHTISISGGHFCFQRSVQWPSVNKGTGSNCFNCYEYYRNYIHLEERWKQLSQDIRIEPFIWRKFKILSFKFQDFGKTLGFEVWLFNLSGFRKQHFYFDRNLWWEPPPSPLHRFIHWNVLSDSANQLTTNVTKIYFHWFHNYSGNVGVQMRSFVKGYIHWSYWPNWWSIYYHDKLVK